MPSHGSLQQAVKWGQREARKQKQRNAGKNIIIIWENNIKFNQTDYENWLHFQGVKSGCESQTLSIPIFGVFLCYEMSLFFTIP